MKKKLTKPLSNRCLEKIAKLRLGPADKSIIKKLMTEPIAYIPNDSFIRSSVMKPIMDKEIQVIPGTSISRENEQILFMQMNYARHKLCLVRRRLMRQAKWQRKDVRQLLNWHQKQLEYRSKIVTCNMGLVLSMAQRVDYPGVEFTDLISEGSMALLRSTEKFDCSRGFKFSTYACRAIFKGFSRAAKQNYRYHSMFPTQLDTSMEKEDQVDRHRENLLEELADEFRTIMQENLAELSDIEMSVVKLRFSLDNDHNDPLTLKQVGAQLGLTKERIRQIQNKALIKLRMVAEERLIPA